MTIGLLMFVAAGVGTIVEKEFRGKPAPSGPPAGGSADASIGGRRLIAYYFVGNVRCSSCRKIEEVSRRTIEETFRQELSGGRLRFRVVNVDRPENRHFLDEFRLEGSALVLVEMRDGKTAGSKNLPDVWALVEDVPKLETYVRSEVRSALERI
ncbi:MAG: hypothetical protein HZB86_04440 [Deltaproteobacteria bacterium]|nr:hypothetical protein [Deltaproteobacteria bacterium]